MDHHFVKVRADTKAIQQFFVKLLGYKADHMPQSPPNL
jgi:hypothetical protein